MKKFILPVLFLIPFALAGTALAQNWIHFTSKTNLFKLRIYDNVEEDISKFRISDKTVIQYGQSVSTFDQRAFKGVVKNYIVKFEQTLGYVLSQQDAIRLIKKELDLYTDYYSSLGGVLREKKEAFVKDGFPAGEIYVKYDDPQLGEQSIRITILFTETSKIRHIISGPDSMMKAFKTREHYESLNVDNGYVQERGSIQEEWRAVTSPLRLFTVFLPEPNTLYFPKEYSVSNSERIEVLNTVFHDPIWNMDVYYNVYGYLPNGEVNDMRTQSIVTERHIKKHRLNADGMKFRHMTIDDRSVGEIAYDIIPPKGKPNVRWVKLKMTHQDNKVIVHELLGPRHLVDSPFFDYLISNVKFHPQLYLTAEEAAKMEAAEKKAKAARTAELKKLMEQKAAEEKAAEEKKAQEKAAQEQEESEAESESAD